jgi:hypothetical protein
MSKAPAENVNHLYITGISFIAALGGYLFGFDFAVISGGLPFLEKYFGLNAYKLRWFSSTNYLEPYLEKIDLNGMF